MIMTYTGITYFFLFNCIIKLIVGIKNNPIVSGKNQIPNPDTLPFAVRPINKIIAENKSPIISFKSLISRVALVYCFKTLSSVILTGKLKM